MVPGSSAGVRPEDWNGVWGWGGDRCREGGRKRGNKKKREPIPRLSAVIRDLTPESDLQGPPNSPHLWRYPWLFQMGLLSSGAPAPSLRALWGGWQRAGSQAPGRQACSAAGMHGPGRAVRSGPGAGWGARVLGAPLQPRQVQAGPPPSLSGPGRPPLPTYVILEGPAKRQPQGFQPRASGAHLAKFWLPEAPRRAWGWS